MQPNFPVPSGRNKGRKPPVWIFRASRSYAELRRRRGLLPESGEKISSRASSGCDKWRRRRNSGVASIQYGYSPVPASPPRRSYIPLNPPLRRRGTAREIRQDDGHPLNSPGCAAASGMTPRGYRMCLREMKFWSGRARSPARSTVNRPGCRRQAQSVGYTYTPR